jgi:small subunit ribosomal protein S16
MATVIRFARHGTKKKPYFRIVVQDQRSPRDGRFIDHIGAFDPIKGTNSLTVQRDRLEYWLSTGAQISDSVRNRLRPLRRQWEQPASAEPKLETKPEPKKDSKKEKTKEA